MLGEESVKNFAPFKGSAVIAFFLSHLALVYLLMIAYPLMLLFINILPPQASRPAPQLPVYAVLFGLLLLVLLIYLYAREFFKTFLFELREDYFFSRKGVITPDYTIIPYENIQDVHLDQGVVEKILGLWTVRIYTATFSERGADAVPGLGRENAKAFKDSLFKKIRGVKQVVD